MKSISRIDRIYRFPKYQKVEEGTTLKGVLKLNAG